MSKKKFIIKESTIHGINHITSSSTKLAKFLWLILFLCGITGIGVNIVFVTIKYFSNPVILSHFLDHEAFIWPDLTFCNPTAPYHFKKDSNALSHWNHISKQTKKRVHLFTNDSNLFKIVHYDLTSDLELEERTLNMASADPQKLDTDWYGNEFLHVSYTKTHSGIVFTKEYPGSRPNRFKEDVKHMFSTQIVQIGNNIPCHTFHMEKSRLLDPKKIQSLIFTFKFDPVSYKIFNSSYVYRSIFLYVTQKDELPDGKEIILTPGFSNNIKIEQNRYQYQGIRRHCRNEQFKVTLYDGLLNSTREYEGDYNNCKEIVSQRIFVENCNCYSPFLPIYKIPNVVPRICLNSTFYSPSDIQRNAKCMVQVYEKYRNRNLFHGISEKQCGKYQSHKCDSVSYKVDEQKEMFVEIWSNSSNDRRYAFIKKFYENYYEKTTIDDDFMRKMRDSYIRLVVERQSEFGDLYKEQHEYPLSELLSDIGGLMGLYLGMSVIGLFEVIQYFFIYILGFCRQKKTPSSNKNEVVEQMVS